jgi:hypothetical protein
MYLLLTTTGFQLYNFNQSGSVKVRHRRIIEKAMCPFSPLRPASRYQADARAAMQICTSAASGKSSAFPLSRCTLLKGRRSNIARRRKLPNPADARDPYQRTRPYERVTRLQSTPSASLSAASVSFCDGRRQTSRLPRFARPNRALSCCAASLPAQVPHRCAAVEYTNVHLLGGKALDNAHTYSPFFTAGA